MCHEVFYRQVGQTPPVTIRRRRTEAAAPEPSGVAVVKDCFLAMPVERGEQGKTPRLLKQERRCEFVEAEHDDHELTNVPRAPG